MENALLIGLSRQIALQRELDVVANNIANMNTTGFKADGSVFEEYLMPVARAEQFAAPDRRLSYVQDRATWHDFSQGPIQQTGNPLDVAIDGDGFLVVQTAARRALHPQRRAADQRHRPARDQRRRRCSATAGRSSSSPPTATSRSPPTARSRCAKARASTSDSHARQAAAGELRRAAAAAKGRRIDLRRARRRHAAAAAGRQRARRAGRDREIERARRDRDGAHDRDHAHLHPDRQACCSSRATCAGTRSTSSPKFRPK